MRSSGAEILIPKRIVLPTLMLIAAIAYSAGVAAAPVSAASRSVAHQSSRTADGAIPAQVVDVPSCITFFTSSGGDPNGTSTACQALGTVAQTLNLAYSKVFACGWAQSPAILSGQQVDSVAVARCLGLIP